MALSKEQEVWLKKMKTDYELFLNVPYELKTEEFCLIAVQEYGRALYYVPPAMKTEALCLAAVQKNGNALKYVPEVLKTKSVCLAAARQNIKAFKFVPENLRDEVLRGIKKEK